MGVDTGVAVSVFTQNILTDVATGLIGFGATLNPDGSVSAILGATMEYVTGAPAAVRNGGSLALRSNGTLYITAGAGVYFSLGGVGAGWNLPDNIAGVWGTTTPNQVSSTYVSASTRFDLLSRPVNSVNNTTPSVGLRFRSGDVTQTAAAVGSVSGNVDIRSGVTDTTNAGGTAGNTGDAFFGSGNSTSTTGVLSGSTGAANIFTGDSVDANSGNIVLQTGTAGLTRGTIDINTPVLDFVTQATSFTLISNTASALGILQGANGYFVIDTTTAAPQITIGQAPSSAVGAPNAAVNIATVGAITTNGTDFGARLCLVEDFHQKCGVAGDLGAVATAVAANLNLVIVGTNSTTAQSTYAAGGGNTLTTTGVAGQTCMIPQAAGQSMWGGTTWSSSDSVRWKANVQSPATITTMVAAAGLKLTFVNGVTLFDNTTDGNQAYFGFATDARYGANAGNWFCVFRTGGVSANVDSGVAFSPGAAATNYRLVIDIDAARVTRFYINGVLVNPTPGTLGAAAVLLPFAGVETLDGGGAPRAITVQRMAISKVLV